MVPYTELQRDIAIRIGEEDKFWDNIRNRNRLANNRLCNYHKAVLMSDMDIEDNIRFQFSHTYQNTYNKGSKSYLDIEADVINAKGDFVELGECPINAVSFIDDQTLVIHSFLLRNPQNPLIEEFERMSNTTALHQELKEFLIDAVGGPKNADKYKVNKMSVQFHFYDEAEELTMLTHLFNYINNLKPDFVLAWNMAFDIPYIIQRIINLGGDPKKIMCHPDFRFKEVKYFIDERNQYVYEERNDYAKISSYSVFLDQMIHFASRRKGGKALPSYKLDFIGQMT
jgi:DNA polymerase elongation subunit (family B)